MGLFSPAYIIPQKGRKLLVFNRYSMFVRVRCYIADDPRWSAPNAQENMYWFISVRGLYAHRLGMI
jgi:hypothetical protein